MCNGSEDTTALAPCVSIRQLLCWVLPFSLCVRLTRRAPLSRFSCSSLREAYLCLRSRQIVLGCAHWHSYSNSYFKKSTLKPSYCIHKATWEHLLECLIPSGQPSVAQWTISMLQGHSGQNNQLTDWYDVSWRSANKIKRKKNRYQTFIKPATTQIHSHKHS